MTKNQLKAKAQEFKMSVAEYNRLQDKAVNILKGFNTGYSMGEYRTLYIKGKAFATAHNLHTYAKSCTYRPKHGSIKITLNKTDLRNITLIEGVWTIVNPGGVAKWLEPVGYKGSFQVCMVKGFLYGTSHSTISLRDAIKLQKQKELASKRFEDNMFVGMQHIKAKGACNAGITQFCQIYNLNIEYGYNVAFLKQIGGELINRYL